MERLKIVVLMWVVLVSSGMLDIGRENHREIKYVRKLNKCSREKVVEGVQGNCQVVIAMTCFSCDGKMLSSLVVYGRNFTQTVWNLDNGLVFGIWRNPIIQLYLPYVRFIPVLSKTK